MGLFGWSLALPLLFGVAQERLPAGWKEITAKETGFSVAMPAEPMIKKQAVKTVNGLVNVMMYIADGRNDSNFVVSYSDFPTANFKKADIDKRLDQARDGAITKAGGKKRSEEKIQLMGHPGREIVIEKNGEIIVKMRLYLVKNRLYQVMVVGQGAIFTSRDVGAFFDSFHLSD
ncbi:MAG TPA: hypothetical protein VFE62_15190 [Gemmataceae bacterium]|nr:hypothetical protein [Gemmataceae bacterium]